MDFIVAGSAILLLDNKHGFPHVWFVLTNPDADGKILIAMLRTHRVHTDHTTILAPGEYAFGDNVEGCIDYSETQLVPTEKLAARIRNGTARTYPSLSPELLVRAQAGLLVSGHVPNWVVTYLRP